MNLLDLIILIILLVNIGLGYAFGIVRRVLALVGVFAGVGAATLTSAQTSTTVAGSFGWQSAIYGHVVTYAAIVLFVVVLFEVLGAAYQRFINQLMAPLFDRVAGVLSGTVVGAFEVTLILIVGVGLLNTPLPSGTAYPPSFLTMQQMASTSALAPHFYSLVPLTRTIFSMVLPADVSAYFTQLLGH